ncbi:MAG: hypothetical protein E6706_03320 [Anaerococcus hydrogenalis]|nr:hypothetical protein [Anaerococcus hydrogenalis]
MDTSRSFSKIKIFNLYLESLLAIEAPLTPAPIIITSYSSLSFLTYNN